MWETIYGAPGELLVSTIHKTFCRDPGEIHEPVAWRTNSDEVVSDNPEGARGTSMRRQSTTVWFTRAPDQDLPNRIGSNHVEAWVAEFHEMVTEDAAGQYPGLGFCTFAKFRKRSGEFHLKADERGSRSRELWRMSFKVGPLANGSRSSSMKSKGSGASVPKGSWSSEERRRGTSSLNRGGMTGSPGKRLLLGRNWEYAYLAQRARR
jgi:hypothetical protein